MELTLNDITFKENTLAEIAQTIPTLFSFAKVNADNTVDRLHEFVKCRDFLGDVIEANYNKIPLTVYGFNAGRVKHSDSMELIVKFPSQEVHDNFLANYEKILHPIEQANELELTSVKSFLNVKNNTVLITGDKWWSNAVPLVSLYTFLIKVCCYAYKEPTQWLDTIPSSVEATYVSGEKRKELFKNLIANLKFIFTDFPTKSGWANETNKYVVHNTSGFYSLFMNMCLNENYFSKKFWDNFK